MKNLTGIIIEAVEQKLKSELVDDTLIALALTGSRAAGFHHEKSDFDFFAVVESDKEFGYYDLALDGYEISIKVEGKQRFENRVKSPLNTFAEQGSIVWLPYAPFVGEDYLGKVEGESRSVLLDRFIQSLPFGRKVRVEPERIAEWPFIKEALIWPFSGNRLKAMANSGNNPLEKVIPKYIKSLEEQQIYLSSGGRYILQNIEIKRGVENSFVKKAKQSYRRLRKKHKNLTPQQYMLGALFVALQIPERISNLYCTFPEYDRNGDFLEYAGPTLKEFVNSREHFNILRNQTKYLKHYLLFRK